MSDLLLMTNADAANTLSIVAWIILFFILLNVAILVYTIIRNKRNAAKEITLQTQGAPAEPEKPEKKEQPILSKKEEAAEKKAEKKDHQAAEKEAVGQKTEMISPAAAETPAPVRVAKKPQTAPMPVVKAEAEADSEDTFNMALTDVSNPERRFVAEGKKEYLVGRKPQMDLCIPDDGYVSGTHCKFDLRDGVLFITDMGSSNGTKVNGNKIEEATPLQDNDVVRIGKVEYRVNY